MSAQRWEPGARAAIVISEHFENMNRVVTLIDMLRGVNTGTRFWKVRDGKQFKGYDSSKLPERVFIWADILCIEQWKLRLLEDGEPVVIRDEIEYATT